MMAFSQQRPGDTVLFSRAIQWKEIVHEGSGNRTLVLKLDVLYRCMQLLIRFCLLLTCLLDVAKDVVSTKPSEGRS